MHQNQDILTGTQSSAWPASPPRHIRAPLSSSQGILGIHGSTVGAIVGDNVVGAKLGELEGPDVGAGDTGGSTGGIEGLAEGMVVGREDGVAVGTGLGGAIQGPQYPSPFIPGTRGHACECGSVRGCSC